MAIHVNTIVTTITPSYRQPLLDGACIAQHSSDAGSESEDDYTVRAPLLRRGGSDETLRYASCASSLEDTDSTSLLPASSPSVTATHQSSQSTAWSRSGEDGAARPGFFARFVTGLRRVLCCA